MLQPVLRLTAGSEPAWTLDMNKLEPGRRYEIQIYAVNDKGNSDPAVTLYAVAPSSTEFINGVGEYHAMKTRTAGMWRRDQL